MHRVPFVTALVLACLGLSCAHSSEGPIRVGILHSYTGDMGPSEKLVAEASLLAIREINQQGGLLGRQIEAVVVDAKSDAAVFAREAERLIQSEGVVTLFGCWTSASRKSVKAVVEKHNHLLFYPLQYEGLEQSPNIVYTGAAPNQQIIPAVKWSFDNLGKRFFLVGSDYLFPRTANAIIQDQVGALGGQILGDAYIPLGSRNVEDAVRQIAAVRPDVILNTINGGTNNAFFPALRAAGITSREIPTVSFSFGESEIAGMDAAVVEGDYAAWNYFQSVESATNAAFIQRFRKEYGAGRTISDPMEAAYFGVYLWAQAVRDSGSAETSAIRQAVGDQSLDAPEGLVYVDPQTQHTWKTARIGRIRNDGQFDPVWSSGRPLRPVPFPTYRFRSEWLQFLTTLYEGWGGRWTNPEGL